jgi:hypothetical protein
MPCTVYVVLQLHIIQFNKLKEIYKWNELIYFHNATVLFILPSFSCMTTLRSWLFWSVARTFGALARVEPGNQIRYFLIHHSFVIQIVGSAALRRGWATRQWPGCFDMKNHCRNCNQYEQNEDQTGSWHVRGKLRAFLTM